MESNIFTIIMVLFFSLGSLQAQSAKKNRTYNMIRYQDDFAFLSQDSLKEDIFDPIKYISIASQHQSYLSIGGELRHQYQYYQNPEWNGSVDNNGHFMQRYMLHADFHLGKHFRLFAQMNSGLSNGRTPGPRAIIDENKLEANQFFLEFKSSSSSVLKSPQKLNFGIRLGRMEEKFGTARLVATREGQNVRRSFDGIQMFLGKGKWKIDAFALKEIISLPGAFDDVRDEDEWFIGAVAQRKGNNGFVVEPYILMNRDRSALVFSDSSRQYRVSPGVRLFQKNKSKLSWNVEVTGQWGKFGDENVYAWLLAADLKYRFGKSPSRPSAGLSFSYATGDTDTKPGGVGTFESFFPKALFGQAIVLNPSNVIQLHGEFSFHLEKETKLTFSHDQLFRSSSSDVFYDPCANPIVPVSSDIVLSKVSHIGHQTKVELKRQFGPHYFIVLEYAIFPPGRFLREMERTETLHYASAKSIFRF